MKQEKKRVLIDIDWLYWGKKQNIIIYPEIINIPLSVC